MLNVVNEMVNEFATLLFWFAGLNLLYICTMMLPAFIVAKITEFVEYICDKFYDKFYDKFCDESVE